MFIWKSFFDFQKKFFKSIATFSKFAFCYKYEIFCEDFQRECSKLFRFDFPYQLSNFRLLKCKKCSHTNGSYWSPKTPRFGFRIPGTGFRNLCHWNLDPGFIELNSGFQSPGFPIPGANIPHSTSKIFLQWIPETRLPLMGRKVGKS